MFSSISRFGIPTLMVLLGILLNLSAVKDLDKRLTELDRRMTEQFSEMRSRFAVLESDMRQFYHLSGKLEGRIDSLEKSR